jgi:hypothetical protein
MMTRPFTFRAARPIVWMSERGLRRKPLLVGVEDGDERDLGQIEPLAQQVDADEHVELAEAQVAQDVDAVERVDVGVQVANADAELAVVVGEVLGHPLGERRARGRARSSSRGRGSRRADRRPAPRHGRTSTSGSIRPVGRITCSTTTPCTFSISYSPGVAET